jgi:hypothetical protein
MTTIQQIFKIKEQPQTKFNNLKQSTEEVSDYSIKKVVESKEIQTGNHNIDGNRPEVVNVCYGTGSPPAANTTPIGTIYVQYVD